MMCVQVPCFFKALGNAAVNKRGSLGGKCLANIIWSMAKTGLDVPFVFDVLCQAVVQKAGDLSVQDLSNSMWAIARIGTQAPHVLEVLCKAMADKDVDVSVYLFFAKVGKHVHSHGLQHSEMILLKTLASATCVRR